MKCPVHCSKNNVRPLGLLKTFVIPQMEVVNIYGADDRQLKRLQDAGDGDEQEERGCERCLG